MTLSFYLCIKKSHYNKIAKGVATLKMKYPKAFNQFIVISILHSLDCMVETMVHET
jgi:hypothetical protein